MRIGFIDSGVGGLSILSAVRACIAADYIYVMDNRYLPYGEKSEAFIQSRLTQLSSMLINHQVDLIVIACNTATTQAVASLRQQFSIPFVGTVPAIKPAAALSPEGFAVLATPATCKSAYLEGLIEQFAPGIPVQKVGSSELVLLAEQKVWYGNNVHDTVEQVIRLSSLVDTSPLYIVLGCTHFPFLAAEIKSCLPDAVLLDTADAIARRVTQVVVTIDNPAKANGQQLFISTLELNEQQKGKLAELGFDQYECWSKPAEDYSSLSSPS